MNLLDALLAKAGERAAHPCIRTETRTLSYSEFFDGVLNLSSALARAGVQPGQVVAHCFNNELLSLTAMLASAHLGTTQLSVAPSLPSRRRQALLDQVAAGTLITDRGDLQLPGLTTLRVTAGMISEPRPRSAPRQGVDTEAPWLVVTGSGSTGRPKLMPVSHQQQLARMHQAPGWLPYGVDDSLISLIHLDFYASKQRYLEALGLGASIFLSENRQADFSPRIASGEVSVLYGTVFHIEQLLNARSTEQLTPFRQLKALMLGGSTVTGKLRATIRERLSDKLYILYGTNETHTACITRPDEVFSTEGGVGHPFPCNRLEIVDKADRPLPTGEPGLIRLKTPGMIAGYLDDDEATARFFRGGWFYPGDIGKLTTDGELIHLGRADNMMIMNGINIYPAEIEQQMLGHPAVRDAVAVPLPHRVHQHIPVCLVAANREDAGEAELLSYARARLGSSTPHRIYIVDHIPRNEQGKPLMAEINQLIANKPVKPRQLTRAITATFAMPARANLPLLDQWLGNIITGDIGPQLPGAPPSGNDKPAAAVEWLRRCLLLAHHLMLAATMPIFLAPRIIRCDRIPGERHQYQARIALPMIDNFPAQSYQQVLTETFSVAQWLATHGITPANRQQLFDRLQKKVVKPVMTSLGQGKSTLPLLRAAYQRGIPFRHLGRGVYQLGWGARAVYFDRSTTENDSVIGMRLSTNKLATAQLARAAGLPAPRHGSAGDINGAREIATAIGWPVVVKPVDGERGEGVTVEVTGEAALQAAFDRAMAMSKRKAVIVEQQVSGVCHRLFIADGQLLYGVKRLPMSVTGDGQSTVAQLVAAEVARQRLLPPWQRTELQPLDDLAHEVLAKAGFTPSSVPAPGTLAPLRPIETTEWGGVDEEVTDRIHPENLRIAIAAARLFRLQVAGIDIITPDIAVPWYENGAIINEVNYSPLLGGGEISRRWIPEYLRRLVAGDGTIPVEVYVGGKTAWQRAQTRHGQLVQAGVRACLSNHHTTVAPSGQALPLTARGLHQRVRALTLSHDVEHLILVVQNNELLNTGIPLEWVDRVDIVDRQLSDATTDQPLPETAAAEVASMISRWARS